MLRNRIILLPQVCVWDHHCFFGAGSGRRVDDPPFLKVSLDVGWQVSAAGVPGKKGTTARRRHPAGRLFP